MGKSLAGGRSFLPGAKRLAAAFLSVRTVVLFDILGLAAAFLVTARVITPRKAPAGLPVVGVVIVGLALLLISRRRTWTVKPQLSVLDEAPDLITAAVLPALVVFLGASVLGRKHDPWFYVVLAVVTAATLVADRTALRWVQRILRCRGVALQPTLVIGAGHVGALIAKRLLDHPEYGLEPVGFLDKDPLADEEQRSGLPVLGSSYDLARVIDENHIGMVLVAFSTAPHETMLGIVRTCQEKGVKVAVVPRLFETITMGVAFDHLGGIAVMDIRSLNLSGVRWWCKRVFDVLGASALLLLFGPIMAAVAVAIKVDSPGPVFYRQTRTGRDGVPFEMIKFRTLWENAESEYGAMWSDTLEYGSGKNAVTSVGRVLRKTSLDELPQLVNVIRGHMSLVGPRPERPLFVNQFVHEIYRYGDRLRVKAGMTGWAQVHGLKGNGGSLAERVEYDNYYIENWSLWLDFKILLLTLQQIWRDLRASRSAAGVASQVSSFRAASEGDGPEDPR